MVFPIQVFGHVIKNLMVVVFPIQIFWTVVVITIQLFWQLCFDKFCNIAPILNFCQECYYREIHPQTRVSSLEDSSVWNINGISKCSITLKFTCKTRLRENRTHGTTQSKLGILLPKLFWATVRRNCFSDQEKILKFEAEGQEFATICNHFETTRIICSNSERPEQYLVTECFCNLFLEARRYNKLLKSRPPICFVKGIVHGWGSRHLGNSANTNSIYQAK